MPGVPMFWTGHCPDIAFGILWAFPLAIGVLQRTSGRVNPFNAWQYCALACDRPADNYAENLASSVFTG
jgi:hypothetical protein